MPLAIEEASVELYDRPETETAPPARSASAAPDIDRILRELRRSQSRLERLWAD